MADVEDVVQSTMICALKNLPGFRGDSSLFTWLCHICRNQLIDIHRKAARQPELQRLELVMCATAARTPVQLFDDRDPIDDCIADSTRREVRRLVKTLPPRYAAVLQLKYCEDLTVTEMGQKLGLSDCAVQSLLLRARLSFRAVWCSEKHGPAVHSTGALNGEQRAKSDVTPNLARTVARGPASGAGSDTEFAPAVPRSLGSPLAY